MWYDEMFSTLEREQNGEQARKMAAYMKDGTDTDQLERIIANNLGTGEFFIDKAIGWSLREYSKVNPDWVRNFVSRYEAGLSKLSVKEGSKYL